MFWDSPVQDTVHTPVGHELNDGPKSIQEGHTLDFTCAVERRTLRIIRTTAGKVVVHLLEKHFRRTEEIMFRKGR